MKKVRITVTEGKCNQGFHEVGDSWVVDEFTPAGMCTSAFNALFPQILTLACGGEFFWEKNPRVGYACCPDDTGLTFEIKLDEED